MSLHPTQWRRRSGLAAALCLSVLAAGCSSKDKEKEVVACPTIGILSDTARLVQFENSPTTGAQMVFSAEMVNAAGTCDYGRRRVDVAVALQVRAQRGAGAMAGVYPSRYFVAVVDSEDRILAKKYFNLPIVFETTENQAVLLDSVDQVRIPVKNEKAGAKYQVLVGFVLTPDQVNYNRTSSNAAQGGI